MSTVRRLRCLALLVALRTCAVRGDAASNATGWAYVVGGEGNILRTLDHGLTWNCSLCGERRPVQVKLNAVHFVDLRHGFVAGDHGVVLKTTQNGTNWTLCRTGYAADLLGIHALTRRQVYTAGSGGLILRTENGGATWKAMPQVQMVDSALGRQYSLTLRGIRFFDMRRGTAIGSCLEWLQTSGIKEHAFSNHADS